ncbi:MAG: hypothetical protein SOI44_06715 [Lactimicrobium sp.]|uniref:hypothetical protein n=1 Tax=Lactimicrobium sp. TaxID=2563780 RepID=UPI002F356647
MRILRYTSCMICAFAIAFLVPSAQVAAEQSEAGSPQIITCGDHDGFLYDRDFDEINTYHLNVGEKIFFDAYEDAGEAMEGYAFTNWKTDPVSSVSYDASTNSDDKVSPQTGVNTMLTGLYVVCGGALAVFGAAFASAMYIRRKFPH